MFPRAGQWRWPNPGAGDKQDHHTQIMFLGGGHHAVCGILLPCPGIEPVPLLVKAWSPNPWTAREVRTETFDTSINIRLSKSWSYIDHHPLVFLNNYSVKHSSPIKSFVSPRSARFCGLK